MKDYSRIFGKQKTRVIAVPNSNITLTIKHISTIKALQINSTTRKSMEADGITDENLLHTMAVVNLAHEALAGWEGLCVDGSAIPFSEDNSRELLSNDVDIALFVFNQCTSLAEDEQKKKESNVKN